MGKVNIDNNTTLREIKELIGKTLYYVKHDSSKNMKPGKIYVSYLEMTEESVVFYDNTNDESFKFSIPQSFFTSETDAIQMIKEFLIPPDYFEFENEKIAKELSTSSMFDSSFNYSKMFKVETTIYLNRFIIGGSPLIKTECLVGITELKNYVSNLRKMLCNELISRGILVSLVDIENYVYMHCEVELIVESHHPSKYIVFSANNITSQEYVFAVERDLHEQFIPLYPKESVERFTTTYICNNVTDQFAVVKSHNGYINKFDPYKIKIYKIIYPHIKLDSYDESCMLVAIEDV